MKQLDRNKLVWSVDPGDVHTGVACWAFEQRTEKWTCSSVHEWSPEETEDKVADYLRQDNVAALVVETFQLYGDKALQQTGSQFRTSQLIGVLKYLARVHDVPVVMQGASIKTATRSILKAKKAKSLAKAWKKGGHAFDAELHGFYFFKQTADEPVDLNPNNRS